MTAPPLVLCAWALPGCDWADRRRNVDAERNASHGICPSCAHVVLADELARQRSAIEDVQRLSIGLHMFHELHLCPVRMGGHDDDDDDDPLAFLLDLTPGDVDVV